MNITFLQNSFWKKPVVSGGNEFPTDDLIWYINDDDLSDGLVSTWEDLIGSNDLIQDDDDMQPTKSSRGVVHDGNDWMQNVDHDLTITDSFSLVCVCNIVDEGSGLCLSIHDGSSNMTLGYRSKRVTAYYNGTSSDVSDEHAVGNTICIIVTRSDTNGLRIYFDGEQQAEASSYLGIGTDQAYIMLGAYDSGIEYIVPNNHISRLAAFYNVELDQNTIDAIMASDAVSSKIS